MSTYASATDHHVVIHAVSPPKNVSPGYFQVALAVVATILIAPALIVTIPIDALSFYLFKTMPFLNLWNAFRVWQIRHHPDSTLLSAVTDSLGFYDFLDLVVLSGGERSVIFAKRMKNDGGFCFVMFRGFWLSKHADVAKLLTGPQNRSNLIGTWQMEVPLVMSPISPILLSNPSDAHSAVRGLLTGGTVGSEDAQSRLKNASSVLAPIVKEWLTYKKPLDGDFLAKIVFRCIMKLLFDSEPTEDILKSVSKYRLLTTGVLVPRFAHAFTGYAIAKGLKKASHYCIPLAASSCRHSVCFESCGCWDYQ
ncbi:hypothetical protein DFJ73DRAFT_300552 [Zopfochytrium polystomum]|nr:hypothetical protein DFJ73DRAFT_300552 [Zopfochytrium polystomum]